MRARSRTLGTPNACNDCHSDRTAEWAGAAIERALGPQRKASGWHWAAAIHAGRTARADAERQLVRALLEPKTPAIVRATALELLARYLGPPSLSLVAAGARDPDPLVRRAAAAALAAVEPATRVEIGVPLLGDPMLTVRLEALGSLLDVRERLTADARRALESVVAEHRRVQAADGDRAEAHANLGSLEMELGNLEAAEAELRAAIRLSPRFMPARVQLADLLGRGGREAEGEAVLREAIALEPGVADAHHALGLSLVRQRRLEDAVVELGRAADLAPDDSRYAWVLAIALHDGGGAGDGAPGGAARALPVLLRAHERRPADRDVLSTLLEYALELGEREVALAAARDLAALVPWDPGLAPILEQLERQHP